MQEPARQKVSCLKSIKIIHEKYTKTPGGIARGHDSFSIVNNN